MEKRYDDLLSSRLEEILDKGITYFTWNEIYRWYGVQKIAAGTYRDIKSRWQEISRGKLGELMEINLPNACGVYLTAAKQVKTFYPE
jgi:hypothetical protein